MDLDGQKTCESCGSGSGSPTLLKSQIGYFVLACLAARTPYVNALKTSSLSDYLEKHWSVDEYGLNIDVQILLYLSVANFAKLQN
jgi:hypothetical protein